MLTIPKTILIFGGNGFIGAECVDHILNTFGDEYRLILLNRGNWNDWDTNSRIKPRIYENIILDRTAKDASLIKSSPSLKHLLNDENFQFEAIIDFSGFKTDEIDLVLREIAPKKIKLYIYISTDSVYEVCEVEKRREKDAFLLETDSVRPESDEERHKLKKFDSYAHHKLKYGSSDEVG